MLQRTEKGATKVLQHPSARSKSDMRTMSNDAWREHPSGLSRSLEKEAALFMLFMLLMLLARLDAGALKRLLLCPELRCVSV